MMMTTNSTGRPSRRLRAALIALVASALMVACGSGGIGGGGGGQTAGIEGTGIVSGFGSVYVDGIEFATAHTTVTVDGRPASAARLRVGDVVRVSGRIDDDGNASADRIVFDRNIDGPIERIDIDSDDSGTLIALGQTVRFDGDTVFVNTPADALHSGDLIAVSGLSNDDGTLRATLIRQGKGYQPGSTRVGVDGVIRDLDGSGFRLGALTVNYGGAQINGDLSNGAYIRVFGTQGAADAPLDADTVSVRSRAQGDNGERLFLQGLIADFTGLSNFRVNGRRVDASDAERTDTARLAPGAGISVSVSGRLRGDVLIADSIAVLPPPDVMLNARLGSDPLQSDGVHLLGTTWNVRADTLYLDERGDGGAADDRRLRIDRVSPGDTVNVHGYMGRQGLVMTRLTRVVSDAQGNARVRGPIDRITRNGGSARIDVAGAEIVTRNGTTVFRNAAGDAIDANAFFGQATSGAVIDAVGPDNSNQIDTARSIQIVR